MANIDIAVRSLWGAAIFRNYTVSDALTIDDVIALIAADDNLDTNFYKLTLSRDHNITDVAYGDSSTTLLDLGITTGDTFLSKSKAAELFKTDRYRAQLQKLEIAQAKRQADGDTTKPYYDVQNIYSYTALHSAPLAQGRPWVGTAGGSPTYHLTRSVTNVNEGGSFTITLTTTNVANGTSIPYTITGVAGADIGGVGLTGNFTVNNNTATITFNVTADATTEGSETFTLTLDSIGEQVNVLINDTSMAPTYTLTRSTNSINEGESVTITLSTTDVADATTVAYTITGVEPEDINGASLTGNFTINSGVASIVLTATEDFTTEGNQTLTLTLDVQGNTVSVVIVDTSLTPESITEIFTGETTGGVVTVLESQFDASNGSDFIPSNPADGATFTQWTDTNSGTHNANPVGGATTRASYQTNELNTLSVVRFDGNDGLSINPYPGLASLAGVTIFMVAKMNTETVSVNNNNPRLYSTNVSNGIALYYNSTSNRFTVAAATGVGESAQTNDAAFHLHTLAYDGTQSGNAARLKYRYDGTADTLSFTGTVGATTSGSINTLYIGNNNSNNFFTGDIAEFLIFTRVLTLGELIGVESYLKTKWGL